MHTATTGIAVPVHTCTACALAISRTPISTHTRPAVPSYVDAMKPRALIPLHSCRSSLFQTAPPQSSQAHTHTRTALHASAPQRQASLMPAQPLTAVRALLLQTSRSTSSLCNCVHACQPLRSLHSLPLLLLRSVTQSLSSRSRHSAAHSRHFHRPVSQPPHLAACTPSHQASDVASPRARHRTPGSTAQRHTTVLHTLNSVWYACTWACFVEAGTYTKLTTSIKDQRISSATRQCTSEC